MPRFLRGAYLALTAWQLVWFALLPPPTGAQLPWLAAVAITPLLLTLRGVLALRPRTLGWIPYLLIPYFLVAVTEAWSNPPQRLPALVQLVLVTSCVVAIGSLNRSPTQRRKAP